MLFDALPENGFHFWDARADGLRGEHVDDAGAEEDKKNREDHPSEVLRREVVAQVLVEPQPEQNAAIIG